MSIELNIVRPAKVRAKELRVRLKVRDEFTATLHDVDGVGIGGQDDGYVPSFMPGDHYGDYVILDIDIETGQILNWQKPTAGALSEWLLEASK
jgi:hypothetical protein